MSPRLPPKISLRHDWTKELVSKVDRQPEGEVARQSEEEVALQAKFFQPTQQIPNPIRDISGRLDEMQDERKTSRSQEISVRKFKHVHLKTARVSMLSRLMMEQGDLLKTQLQYKTTLKYIMRPERSTLTVKHFVKEWRQTWTSKFQDYHIPL